MKINIAHLYYDLLNLYGEQGNIIALTNAFNKQNIDVNIDLLSIDDHFVMQGDYQSLLSELELDDEAIINKIISDIKWQVVKNIV